MAELGWTALEVLREHLQNLVSKGYMMVAELATCRVPEDPTSPFRREVMSWHARWFGVPSH
jgi:hypothetical protein